MDEIGLEKSFKKLGIFDRKINSNIPLDEFEITEDGKIVDYDIYEALNMTKPFDVETYLGEML